MIECFLIAAVIFFLLSRKKEKEHRIKEIEQRLWAVEYIISRLHFELRRER